MVDGVLIPVSNCSCISVDFWGQTDRNILAAFLTHAHADHIQGLNESWNGGRSPQKTLSFLEMWFSKVGAFRDECLTHALRRQVQGRCLYFAPLQQAGSCVSGILGFKGPSGFLRRRALPCSS